MLRVGLLLAFAGCGPKPSATPLDRLPFAFEARGIWGEVRVIPALALHEPLDVNLDSYVGGAALPYHRRSIRELRTEQLQEVPAAVGLALPGEVNGLLGLKWPGQFHDHRIPPAALDRLRDAVRGERPDLHASLSDAAHFAGGEASLFSWVLDLKGEPLSLRGFPGEVVQTQAGPVVLDHDDEPYLVEAQVGMALVTEDGDVLLRYQDTFHALLSREASPRDTGQQLARGLAEQVVMMWNTEPGVGDDVPPPRRRLRMFNAERAAEPAGSSSTGSERTGATAWSRRP